MAPAAPPPHRRALRRASAGSRGFTLLETGILLAVLLLLGAFLAPAYFRLVHQAREVRTRATLVRIVRGQENYRLAELGAGRYAGDFEELEATGCVPRGDNCEAARIVTTDAGTRRVASARISDGYRLDLAADLDSGENAGWCVTASPTRGGAGRRWYYADESGVLRSDVGTAGRESPPVL